MFKNYFKIAIRNLFKNKVLSFINITGLALGMAGAVLLILNIQYDLGFDQFYPKKDAIFKAYHNDISNGQKSSSNITSSLLAPTLKENYPEIKTYARIAETGSLFSYGEKKLTGTGLYADPSFLGMFSFPLLKGNIRTALSGFQSIVVTEDLARKLFGDEDPMNKIVRADNTDNFVVSGVLKTLPGNTSLRFEYLVPWDYLKSKNIDRLRWDYNFVTTYVELNPAIDLMALNKKVSHIIQAKSNSKGSSEVFLYPFAKEHLYGRFQNGFPAGGNIENVRMLAILTIVILLIACINFMNLSTARSEKRAKEVGVRKVVGAGKRSLVMQFLVESTVMALIAGIIALVIVQLLLPLFASLANIRLSIEWTSIGFWLLAASFILFTGFLAGSYPAFYLSSFQPTSVLKGVIGNGRALVTPRKILVVTQFVFAVLLINLTIVIHKQIDHEQGREIGYNKENLIFHALTEDLRKNYALVKSELLNTGTAVAVCKSSAPVTRSNASINEMHWKGQDEKANVSFQMVTTSGNFIKTNGLTLLAGRDIDMENYPADTSVCLINETAAKILAFKEPIGQKIEKSMIVGVVKDYLIGSATRATPPVLIFGSKEANVISIRLNNNQPSIENLRTAEAVLKKYNPNFLTEYQFASEEFAAKFKEAKNTAMLINGFAFVAIFISCMGLFGLATYMAENRTREIGIRKVLGASISGITALIAKDFVKLVMIAILIASPLAWLFMNMFLSHFDYRTDLSWWILFAAGGSSLLIAVLTISFQSVKAAIANPVKSLRSE